MLSEMGTLLEIRDLKTHFFLDEGTIKAVDGVSFSIPRGKTVGVIGESGCGKSVTAQSILRIVPSPPGQIVGGSILFHRPADGAVEIVDLATLDPKGNEIRNIRGSEISMIFQEPMTSLGPLTTIGNQIIETIRVHERDVTRGEARERTIALLRLVGIPRAEQTVDAYPHELSGGMRQRAMIAMALSCSPCLLIADEPTTGVDVTIEAQIVELLSGLQQERGMSVLVITHNLALVSEMADEVVVMYLGKRAEYATVEQIFHHPLHPYTQALWHSIPSVDGEIAELVPITGSVPSPYRIPSGCVFHPRCDKMIAGVCDVEEPPTVEAEPGHWVTCFLYAGEGTEHGGAADPSA